MIDRPELHSHVTFYAKDPLGKREIFLNGKLSTSEAAVAGCPEFVDVSVTPEQGETERFTLYHMRWSQLNLKPLIIISN